MIYYQHNSTMKYQIYKNYLVCELVKSGEML